MTRLATFAIALALSCAASAAAAAPIYAAPAEPVPALGPALGAPAKDGEPFQSQKVPTADEPVQSGDAVPEPSAWALMIIGFGGAGALLRRRRQLGL